MKRYLKQMIRDKLVVAVSDEALKSKNPKYFMPGKIAQRPTKNKGIQGKVPEKAQKRKSSDEAMYQLQD